MTEPVGSDIGDPDSGDDTVLEQLDVRDTLDDPRVNPIDPLDEGYSPNEKPWGMDAWGVTESEELEGEPLTDRLRREQPDIGDDDRVEARDDSDGGLDRDGAGSKDALGSTDALGEVGDRRAGRLATDDDGSGYSSDEWAEDVGIDGAGASAEEAAVHLVPDPDGQSD